mgnify:CR=1 FL=1
MRAPRLARHLALCGALTLSGAFGLAGCGAGFDPLSLPVRDTRVDASELRFDVLWRTKVGGFSESSFRPSEPGGVAVSDDGTALLVSTHVGRLYALNIGNGSVRWTQDTGGWIAGPAAVSGDLAVVSGADGVLRAFSVHDGEPRWTLETGMVLYGRPIISGGRVYVTGSAESLIVADLNHGREVWRFNHRRVADLEIRGGGTPLITDDAVYVGFADGSLFKLALDGSLVWASDITGGERRLRDADEQPLVVDDTVYAVSHSGGLSAVDDRNGRVRWTLSETGLHRPVLLESGILMTTASDGRVIWLSRETGERIAQLTLNARGLSRPFGWAGYVLTHNSANGLHVLDENRPFIHANFDPGGGIDGPVAFEDNRVYALTNRGQVYALALWRR